MIYYSALIFSLIWGGGECVGCVCKCTSMCADACRVHTQLD